VSRKMVGRTLRVSKKAQDSDSDMAVEQKYQSRSLIDLLATDSWESSGESSLPAQGAWTVRGPTLDFRRSRRP
jgi:hypothetical protein